MALQRQYIVATYFSPAHSLAVGSARNCVLIPLIDFINLARHESKNCHTLSCFG